jgi:hypothetical protein
MRVDWHLNLAAEESKLLVQISRMGVKDRTDDQQSVVEGIGQVGEVVAQTIYTWDT